jgi:hypothetical protein
MKIPLLKGDTRFNGHLFYLLRACGDGYPIKEALVIKR